MKIYLIKEEVPVSMTSPEEKLRILEELEEHKKVYFAKGKKVTYLKPGDMKDFVMDYGRSYKEKSPPE